MTDKNLLFAMLIGEPYLHGLPGNISVMVQLCEKQYEKSMYTCEKLFQEKHPEYKDQFNSWLWIIYKDINKQDIYKTIEYLDNLFTS